MASPSKYNKLAGKSILVIGGTSGMGYCVAEGGIEHGARVIITGSSTETVQRAVQKLHATYPSSSTNFTGFACDLSDAASVEANVEDLLQKATSWASDGKKKLDHVAFLAGGGTPPSPITEMNFIADLPPLMAIRLYGVLAVAKLAHKYVEVAPASSLTFTAGVLIDWPMPGRSLLTAVGGALVTLGRSLAVDLQPIRVNVVSPSMVHTERVDRMVPRDMLGGFLEEVRKNSLVKEIGKPEDVAEAYLYAMKDAFITGEHIRSNGGRLLA